MLEEGFSERAFRSTRVADQEEKGHGQGSPYSRLRGKIESGTGTGGNGAVGRRMEIGQVQTSLLPRTIARPTTARAAQGRNTVDAVKRHLAQACMRVVANLGGVNDGGLTPMHDAWTLAYPTPVDFRFIFCELRGRRRNGSPRSTVDSFLPAGRSHGGERF